MKALYIGRFQPFHNGHLKIIKESSKKYDEIIIGIGSSQYSNTLENPFTSEERKLMIKKTLDDNNISNYRIVELPDIHNFPKWVNHVLSIVSNFDVVISNSPITIKLFSDKGFVIEKTPIYNRELFSGEKIRKKIINDEPWKNSIPKPVYKIIKKINGVSRINKLNKEAN